jgi:UDP-3-O-[3-hydroxymyristoyl] glucosamine N-acyltransferase
MERTFYAHPTADVSPEATIGDGTRIWQHCQVREDAVIGQVASW